MFLSIFTSTRFLHTREKQKCNSGNPTNKNKNKKSCWTDRALIPWYLVLYPVPQAEITIVKRPFNMKGRSLCPATPLSLSVALSFSLSLSIPSRIHSPCGRTEKSVSWCAPSLHTHTSPDNMSQHVTMITSHSHKNCSLHCNIQTKVRH